MIKFFRKIRQRMLSESKFSRYFFYAIGEIILVVIGILIALQINNWNEERKLDRLELSLLQEMKGNLVSDISDMQENIGYHERALQSASIILTSFQKELPVNDSLKKHYGNVALAPKFLVTMTAYNSMKNEGMRIVQNDSLRNAITNHYERNYSYLLSWTESEWNTLFADQNNIYRKYFKEYNYIGELTPVDYTNLAKNQEYINYLNNRVGFIKPTIRYYKVFGIANAEKLIDHLDAELTSREE